VGKTRERGAESYENFKTIFVEEAVSHTQVFQWFRCTSVEIDELSGRLVSSRNEEMIA
jgi:hypothetical protein